MDSLSHGEVFHLLFGLSILLGTARLLGEVARKLGQPTVAGELLSGILLGPTVFGCIAPELSESILPFGGKLEMIVSGISIVSVTLFLFVAGLEVNLSVVREQGKIALWVGLTGIVVPSLTGIACGYWYPSWFGAEPGADRFVFAIFLATALSISALPVISKILMDLGLYRSELGLIVIAAAMVDDLAGWISFSVILGLVQGRDDSIGPLWTLSLTASLVALTLGPGRRITNRALAWVQAHASQPGGTLGFAITLALAYAAITEGIGLHAAFGAFLFGVTLGDSRHLGSRARATLEESVTNVLAPIFFASVGLSVNFATSFDLPLVLTLCAIATVCKLAGCALGARIGGLAKRQSLAIGAALNARGAMEIVLGLLALQSGIIGERMFVALVVMAMFTSMSSGLAIQRLLFREAPLRFTSFMTSRTFVPRLRSRDPTGAIGELAHAAFAGTPVDPSVAAATILSRGRVRLTGMSSGIALPHARLAEIISPIVAVGLSSEGIDFDSPEGRPCHLVALILAPVDDDTALLDIFADVSRTFKDRARVKRTDGSKDFTELLSFVNTIREEDRPV